MIAKAFVAALALLSASCVTRTAPSAVPNIYVVRHLHTPEGATDPDLTAQGHEAAERLSEWFRKDPPKVIFVSPTKRAQQTVAPLVRRLGVVPRIYPRTDTAALVAAVEQESSTVLIVGHSDTVPTIVEGLGGERPAPLVHADFGDVWHISGPKRTTIRVKFVE